METDETLMMKLVKLSGHSTSSSYIENKTALDLSTFQWPSSSLFPLQPHPSILQTATAMVALVTVYLCGSPTQLLCPSQDTG